MTCPYLCVTEMAQRSMTCPHGWLRGHGHALFAVILEGSSGRILSALASLLLHRRCCIYAVHFVAHTMHLCFALTPSSLKGLPLLGCATLCDFCTVHSCTHLLMCLARYSCLALARDLATLMVFMKISCPARFDTGNSRTVSPSPLNWK